ncbi:MAG: PepSY domain-containing protein [Planctomycetota bacterium]|jgi:uncharacterized membrane protein YkoI|nr:PepSY domain-containing protein [Planctomycetota bacterium]
MKKSVRLGFHFVAVLLFAASVAPAAENDVIDANRAIEIALEQTGGGEVVDFGQHSRGRGLRYYRMEILGDDATYRVEIDADTGKLLKFIRREGRRGRDWPESTPEAASASNMTWDRALDIALESVGGGTLVGGEMERRRRGLVFEFEIVGEGRAHEVKVDSAGDIFDTRSRNIGGRRRSRLDGLRMDFHAALAVVEERAGRGMILEYDLDSEGGRLVHEFELFVDGRGHKVEVNDADGTIRRFWTK